MPKVTLVIQERLVLLGQQVLKVLLDQLVHKEQKEILGILVLPDLKVMTVLQDHKVLKVLKEMTDPLEQQVPHQQ